jgi:hypothetical protein
MRPVAPDILGVIAEIHAFGFLQGHREGQLPVGFVAHRLHEFVGDQQAEVELAQTTGFALGADEIHHIGMADIEGAHLRAAATARRGHGETHLVVDIHERQRAGGIGARAGHIRALGTHGREFIADATASLEGEARLVHLVEDVVHGVEDGARHRAIDGRGGRLVFLRAGIGHDAAGGNAALAQRPQKLFVPVFTHFRRFGVGQRAGHAPVGVVHGLVECRTVFGGQAIFLVPDVERSFLERNGVDVHRLQLNGGFDHVFSPVSSQQRVQGWCFAPGKGTSLVIDTACSTCNQAWTRSPDVSCRCNAFNYFWRRSHTQDVVSGGKTIPAL